MRAYEAGEEEALEARRLVSDWTAAGLLTEEQKQRLEAETACGLRTTNVFLRVVLFLFTVFGVAAACGLVFVSARPQGAAAGWLFLVFAAGCYAGAEVAVRAGRAYRFGVEEALACCSVGLVCLGLETLRRVGRPTFYGRSWFVPAAGVALSVWVWRRFGLWYALCGAMVFAVFLAEEWTESAVGRRLLLVGMYGVGLGWVAWENRRRRGREAGVFCSASRDGSVQEMCLAEALLWGGVYLAVNLKVFELASPLRGWLASGFAAVETGRALYWLTWVVVWCLPGLMLARGVRQRNRFVLVAGLVAAGLTLGTNKIYLGWARHTWDPMVFGMVLVGVALGVRRWLAAGEGGLRGGFTADRALGREVGWMKVASGGLGLVLPGSLAPTSEVRGQGPEMAGGASGGGGAGRDF